MAWLRRLDRDARGPREQLLEMLRRGDSTSSPSAAAVDAIAAVRRELFVPERYRELAYSDVALELAPGATISAPSMVAAMVSAMLPRRGLSVLEIGAGSGYAAAVFAAAGMRVTGVEISADLVAGARRALEAAGFAGSVRLEVGDGIAGWPPGAPFDRIVASASLDALPQAWLDQLGEGGVIVYPENRGDEFDVLVRVTRTTAGWTREDVQLCKFVRMQTGGPGGP
jgi:protein-L-isoaspartate(D-aspartate) O-methyltransferase